MGDDLYIARKFSNAALADISAIRAIETRTSSENIARISAKLVRVQSGAKQLRARGIYQSAQIVIEGLNPTTTSDNNFGMRLSALSRLVTQYSDGLSEVEIALSQNPKTQDKRIQDTRILKSKTIQNDVAENIIDIPAPPSKIGTAKPETIKAELSDAGKQSDDDKQIAARAVLTKLMPLTQGGEAAPLQALLDYDPNAAASPKPELDPKLELGPALNPAPLKAVQRPAPQIPLEYVLRDAIQDALSIARMSGKTISISYDVGQEHIDQTATNSLERRLCDGLRALILQSLPQDGVGHIDINMRGKDMVIDSKHKLPRLLPQSLKGRKTADGCEIVLPLIAKREAAPLEPTLPAVETYSAPPLALPMITDETEQKLRAQLGALMGGQNLNEALHMDDNIIVMTDEVAKKADTLNTGGIGAGI